jgi:hypothetical protein
MKRELIVAILFLLVLAALVWLNGRADSEHFRWMLAASVVLIAAVASWRWRSMMWAPPLVCGVALLVLFATFLTSPAAIATVFEPFAGKVLTWYAIAVLAWFYARALLPRAREPSQGNGILALGGILATALVVTSMVCWLEAVDVNALRKNPVVTTSAGIKEQRDKPWGSRRLGIFAVGRIAAGNTAGRQSSGADSYVAYFNAARGIGGSGNAPVWLPLSYSIRMADGETVAVQGVNSVRQTNNWPECGPRLWQRCLRVGDPVIIWAEPGETTAIGSGRMSRALTGSRMIAYGTMEDFRDGYLARALATARIFGWLALALIPLSLVPALMGFLHFRRIRRRA